MTTDFDGVQKGVISLVSIRAFLAAVGDPASADTIVSQNSG